MTVQLSGLWLPSPKIPIPFTQYRTSPNPNPKLSPTTALSATASLSSPPPTIQASLFIPETNSLFHVFSFFKKLDYSEINSITKTLQIVGGKTPTWREKEDVDGAVEDETFWAEMDADLSYWTRPLRPVQV